LEDKVNKTKQFASFIAAVAMLVGTSAFAESRHRDATSHSDGGHSRGTVEHRDSSRSHDQQRNDTRSFDRSNQSRSWDRTNQSRSWDNRSFDNRSNQSRSFDRSYDNRGFNNSRSYDNRSFDRNGGFDRNRGYAPAYNNRGSAFYHDGRISRIERWNGGYRVYVGGADFPFFIPEARFRLFPWRVGLSIHIGGFYNPLGYYDYYDAGPYGAYSAGPVAAGDIHGIVESVDYRRDSLVIRDDVSGQFVTVMMRGGDPRFDSLRAGDSVDLSGEWVRGYFQAYAVAQMDNGYYQR
jgi:hypothetical protein